jgi:hypothetical protein
MGRREGSRRAVYVTSAVRAGMRRRMLVLFVVALVALLVPTLALATQFFSGALSNGQFTYASTTAVSDQTQKNSGSGCALTFFNIVGSNVYQTCANTTFEDVPFVVELRDGGPGVTVRR